MRGGREERKEEMRKKERKEEKERRKKREVEQIMRSYNVHLVNRYVLTGGSFF